jgi:hypothetical protein
MRRSLALLVGIAIAVILGLYLAHRETPQPASQRPVEPQNAAVSAAPAAQNRTSVTTNAHLPTPPAALITPGTAAKLSAPPAGPGTPAELSTIPPETAVENMGRAIHQYGQMFGGNPVGTNPEFAKQLGGDNPKHIDFISADAGMRLDSSGELIDPWGTPYFFHQISGSDTEVRSAGPDKIMYTADDIVVH